MINFHDITPEDRVIVFLKKDPESLIALWVLQQKLGEKIVNIIDAGKLKEKEPLPELAGMIVLAIGTLFDLETMRHIAARSQFVFFSAEHSDKSLYSGFNWAYIRTGRSLARMIWEYCRGGMEGSWILDYTENLKRWKWKAHNPLYIQEVFHSSKITKEFLDDLSKQNPESVEDLGYALLQKKEKENDKRETASAEATKPRGPSAKKKESGTD